MAGAKAVGVAGLIDRQQHDLMTGPETATPAARRTAGVLARRRYFEMADSALIWPWPLNEL